MPDRRGSRFALEVLFLAALAVGLTIAQARSIAIAGVMALGWLLVAAVEWAAWRGEPHFGSGLPPRWYVPRTNLPPPQPLEAVVSGYPEGRRDEAPTWIASAALREEVLGEWPLAAPVATEEAWTAVELPPAPEPAPQPEAASEPDPANDVEAVPEPEQEPGAEPEQEPGPEPEQGPGPVADQPPPAEPQLDVELTRSARGVARYSLDPLAEQPRRRFGRGGEAAPSIEVPARPERPRALPDGPPFLPEGER